MRTLIASFLAALALNATAGNSWAINGKVIHVDDGDTLKILQPDLSKVTVRLSDIDAPETSHGRARPGQPYSQASKQALAALAHGQQAIGVCYELDRWQRAVCSIQVRGADVGSAQLQSGMAWVNRLDRRYVRNPQSSGIEAQAQAARVGLWSPLGPQAVPPWVWRRDCWKDGACAGAGD